MLHSIKGVISKLLQLQVVIITLAKTFHRTFWKLVSFFVLGFYLFPIDFAVKEFINCQLSDASTPENYLSWHDKLYHSRESRLSFNV